MAVYSNSTALPAINRRTLLTSTPALALAVATPAAALVATTKPADAAPVEAPVTVVNNLASDLSYALDDWMDDISHPDCPRQLWMAHIYPASHSKYAVVFENIRARRVETPEERYHRAKQEFIAAMKELYPSSANWKIVEYDDSGGLVPMFMIIRKEWS